MSERIELDVRGMTCGSCANHVTAALQKVPGVLHAEVPGWETRRAVVDAMPGVGDAQLSAAVVAAGYEARVAERPDAPSPTSALTEGAADFDLLVIGAGSAGFAAAIKGVELGFRVAMAGDGTLGGTCINVGCVPSKTLIRAAHAWHRAEHHPFAGVGTKQVALDWDTVRREKDTLVSAMRQEKYADVLAAYPSVTFIPGRARFEADGTVQVGDRLVSAERYVLATGALPRMVPIPGAAEAGVLTSTTVMDLPALPESMIVLGGRAVALELGQAMARFGVRVTILQRSNSIIPHHEPELARALTESLVEEGIEVVAGVQVEHIDLEDGRRVVHARVGERAELFRAEQLLMAMGREPQTAGMGLEQVGVEVDGIGAVRVDAHMRTSNPRVYAAGDVSDKPEFVYVAAAGGAVAAENALAGTDRLLDLSAMPGVIFTDPQVATVGLTEAAAIAAGRDVQTATLPLTHVARAIAARDTRGLIKLVADRATGSLLGAHAVAADAGEVIQTAVLAVKCGLTVDDLTGTLFPYLTMVEGLKLAALSFSKDVSKLSCCAV